MVCPEHGAILGTDAPPHDPPPRRAGQRIFLSYGRDRHRGDALRIKLDLESRGHEVWFDLERLKDGRDWGQCIEDGLKWCDKVVLLMTPHSVRRRNTRDPLSEDGYCLNEIAKALERNKLIIPVMLASLEPDGMPTSICRIQYLDLRDAMPIAERGERYAVSFERLIQAIEHDELDFEGGQARLNRLLRPLSFEAEIGRHVARFRGRGWLLDAVDRWLRDEPHSRIFWLTGGPGMGKTAFAAHLCHARFDVAAYHLCVAGHQDKGDPRRALLSITYQLAQRLSEFDRRLQKLDLEGQILANCGTLFDNLLVQPLTGNFPAPATPLIVVVDAIDEATRNGRNEMAEFIRDYWDQTPPWLRLFVTSRPEAEVMATLASLRPHVLDARTAENIADLTAFVTGEIARRAPANADAAAVARHILKNSEGVFLYAMVVLDELERGSLDWGRLHEFPAGLAGCYQRFFQRQFPDAAEYASQFKPIVEAVCAQREALPVAVLAAAAACEESPLRQRLVRLGSLFPLQRDGRDPRMLTVSPFHKSLRDWLSEFDPRTHFAKAGAFSVDLLSGHRLLAQAATLWERAPAGAPRRYFLRHGAAHLAEAGQLAQATAFLHDLLRRQPLPSEMQAADLRSAATQLFISLKDCAPDEAQRISPDQLLDLAFEAGSFDFDVLAPVLGLLRKYSVDRWPELRQKILRCDRWHMVYAASFALADACREDPSGRGMEEIVALTSSDEMGDQELGLYAVKLLGGKGGSLNAATARRFIRSSSFVAHAVFNEFLLSQALLGDDVWQIVQDEGWSSSPWPYHRTQTDDLAAVQALVRSDTALAAFIPAIAKAYNELRMTFGLRDALSGSAWLQEEPLLRSLVNGYEELPATLDLIRRAGGRLHQCSHWAAVLRVLFGHPSWEVRAPASVVAASLYHSQPELAAQVEGWISDPDWRVRYAAIECAYHLAAHDEGALFARAIQLGAHDPQSWVRGITADCLAEWIVWVVNDNSESQRPLVKRFSPQIWGLLHDTDMWVLESMVYLVRHLASAGVDALPQLGGNVGGLLGQIPGWNAMERWQLQPALDALVQRAAAELDSAIRSRE